MAGPSIHVLFDLLAAACAFVATATAYRTRLAGIGRFDIERYGMGYAVAILLGAGLGGYCLGTLNLWLTGIPGVGRSILGAFAGAIVAVEIFKYRRGFVGSTGVIFVPSFCATIAIGRLGCFAAGLDDQTYGIPTDLPWGIDHGDGIPRHPVALYESAVMASFGAFAAWRIAARDPGFLVWGFYAMAAVYAAQRFCWEFLKPYATLIGPLNLFHFICAGVLGYALIMIGRPADARA